MKRIHNLPIAPVLIGVFLLGACGSTKLHSKNKATLERAVDSYAQGDHRAVAQLSQSLVDSTSAEPNEYRLQRYYAAFLLTQAHVTAAFSGQGAFLETQDSSVGLLGGSNRSEFSISHAVAGSRTAGYCKDWNPGSDSPATVRAEQLPGSLASLGLTNVQRNLALCRIAVLTRLGFSKAVRDELDKGSADKLEDCEALMEEANVPTVARPWITYALYDHLKPSVKGRAQDAFRFAVRTLFPKDGEVSGHIGQEREREIRDWITEGSEYRFFCPNADCEAEANPGQSFCTKCNETDLIEFLGSRRDEG